jgi:hypothetical protein
MWSDIPKEEDTICRRERLGYKSKIMVFWDVHTAIQ